MQEGRRVRKGGMCRDEELMPGGEKEREKLESCLVQLRTTCDVVLL